MKKKQGDDDKITLYNKWIGTVSDSDMLLDKARLKSVASRMGLSGSLREASR